MKKISTSQNKVSWRNLPPLRNRATNTSLPEMIWLISQLTDCQLGPSPRPFRKGRRRKKRWEWKEPPELPTTAEEHSDPALSTRNCQNLKCSMELEEEWIDTWTFSSASSTKTVENCLPITGSSMASAMSWNPNSQYCWTWDWDHTPSPSTKCTTIWGEDLTLEEYAVTWVLKPKKLKMKKCTKKKIWIGWAISASISSISKKPNKSNTILPISSINLLNLSSNLSTCCLVLSQVTQWMPLGQSINETPSWDNISNQSKKSWSPTKWPQPPSLPPISSCGSSCPNLFGATSDQLTPTPRSKSYTTRTSIWLKTEFCAWVSTKTKKISSSCPMPMPRWIPSKQSMVSWVREKDGSMVVTSPLRKCRDKWNNMRARRISGLMSSSNSKFSTLTSATCWST